MKQRPFHETVPLADMTDEQWESLCDGCGRCCLHKLEDDASGDIHYSDVACQLLDTATCRCQDYAHRTQRVPGCVAMSPRNFDALRFLPVSCAYRRLHEGRPLASWHPLVSGRTDSVAEAGISVRHQAISEVHVAVADIQHRLRPDIEWRPLDNPLDTK
ncbi:MAG: YcgN family cysteine cluster protein [Gammaproteobacteria bacterium]